VISYTSDISLTKNLCWIWSSELSLRFGLAHGLIWPRSTTEYISNTTSIYKLRPAIKCAAESDVSCLPVPPPSLRTHHTIIDNRLYYYLEPIILLTTNPGYTALKMKLQRTLTPTTPLSKHGGCNDLAWQIPSMQWYNALKQGREGLLVELAVPHLQTMYSIYTDKTYFTRDDIYLQNIQCDCNRHG
jgi:hypothetical protein